VNDQKGLFKCFACQTGGDGITFIQKYKNLSFKESLKEAANILGLNSDVLDKEQKQDPRLNLARKILSKAALLYRKTALETNPQAFSEFIQKRSISPEVAEKFQLGFAPGHSILSKYLLSIPNERERKEAIEMALYIKIIKPDQHKKDHYYDKFRDRIMFPIWDQFGHVQGFTARAIREDQIPKYLNSDECFVFSKRHLLYPLHLAKPFIREKNKIIICEGNMDAMSLFQYGFTNTVAIMGTAFNEQGLSHLKGLTTNIWLALDSDTAGLVATSKIAAMYHKIGVLPHFVSFLPHKDPDDFLKAEGPISLQKRIDEAPTYIDYALQKLIPEKPLELIEQKQTLLKLAFEQIAPLGIGLSSNERLLWFAQKLGLRSDSETIKNEFSNFLKTWDSNSQPRTHKIPSPNSLEVAKNKIETSGKGPLEGAPTSNNDSEQGLPSKDRANNDEIVNQNENSLSENKQNVPFGKADLLLLKFVLEHPNCLPEEKLVAALDLIENLEVKQYVAWLRRIYFEIDESEFVNVAFEVLNGQIAGSEIPNASLQLRETVGAMLYNFSSKQVSLPPPDTGAESDSGKKDATRNTNYAESSHQRDLEEKARTGKLVNDLIERLNLENIKARRDKIMALQKTSQSLEESEQYLIELNSIQKELNQKHRNKKINRIQSK